MTIAQRNRRNLSSFGQFFASILQVRPTPGGVFRLPLAALWLLIAAIAVSLAYWTWRLAPLPTGAGAVRAAPASMSGAKVLPDQNWFAAAGGGKVAASGRYGLRWLYPGRPGVCILAMPGLQDKTFRIGDEIEPGVKLKEVGKDYVLIEGRAGAERIDLPARQEVARPVTARPLDRPVDPTAGNR